MDTGVRDLKTACFKANSTWINDIGSKDLSNRPIYTVLNTLKLDMILQLKYTAISINVVGSKRKARRQPACLARTVKICDGEPFG